MESSWIKRGTGNQHTGLALHERFTKIADIFYGEAVAIHHTLSDQLIVVDCNRQDRGIINTVSWIHTPQLYCASMPFIDPAEKGDAITQDPKAALHQHFPKIL